jgi:hypothetical protein
MTTGTKIDEKLDRANNFRAWRYRVNLLLEEHELDKFIIEEVQEPQGDEAKEKYKDMVRAKRIIADSIKDHLLHHISSLSSPKRMIDTLTHLFEGSNINRRMTLRSQLKNVKMQNSKTIHSYFSRVNQIKEQIEAIGDSVEGEEMVMTTLNGLPRSWDAFIQGICSRKKLPKFNRIWEDCNQTEARTAAREEKMGDEDQALVAHTRKGKNKKEHSLSKKFKMAQRNNSKIKCYCCQELGHFVRDCPLIVEIKNKKGSKRHQAHTVEDDEPPKKVAKQDESSDEDYVLISALTGTFTHGSDNYLIGSGASKHMTRYKDSPHKVKLGDDYQYPIKGVGEASYKLNLGKPMKMKEVLYVPGLKKNLLSISALDKKGFRVAFIDGQVLMWPKGKTLDDAVVIGFEGGLYKLKGHSDSTMVHDIVNPSELWHRRFSHLHFKALLIVSKMVIGLP